MTFTESVKKCLTKDFFTFSGRSSRSEYWWFVLFEFLVSFICALISYMLSFIVDVVLFIPVLAVAVRRLHDSGLSGLYVLFPVALYLVIALLVDIFGIYGVVAYFGIFGVVAYILLGLVYNVYLYCRKSDPIQNKYGIPPEHILQSDEMLRENKEERKSSDIREKSGEAESDLVHRVDLEKNMHRICLEKKERR